MPILRLALILFCLCGLANAASAACVWRGTAPFCKGSCKNGEVERRRDNGASFGAEDENGNEIEPSSGALCVTGSKALCCKDAPAAPKAEANPDCNIGGTVRTDIAQSDCLEAQKTGCIRRLLNDEQYGNCLAANRRKNGKVITIGKKKRPVRAVQATDVYAGNDGQGDAICTMDAGDSGTLVTTKAGEEDWVEVRGISGGCGGKTGWVWNGGSLKY